MNTMFFCEIWFSGLQICPGESQMKKAFLREAAFIIHANTGHWTLKLL